MFNKFRIILFNLMLILGSLQLTAQEVTFKGEAFGADITAEKYSDVESVVDQLKEQESLQTAMKATVTKVCQAKGCWMSLTSGAEDVPEIFVQFKDYGFFVPKDIAGREVIVEGAAYKDVTSVEDLRHFAEDAGKTKEEIEAITEPKEELKFLASGVLLLEE